MYIGSQAAVRQPASRPKVKALNLDLVYSDSLSENDQRTMTMRISDSLGGSREKNVYDNTGQAATLRVGDVLELPEG